MVRVDGVRHTAARQAWIERYGDPGDRLVLHKCSGGSGDFGCINVRHLRLGNDADNNRDRNEAGRTVLPYVRGEAHGNAKLNREAVREIRTLSSSGMPHHAISERYPVSRRTITKIVARRTWAWLDAPDEESAS
ncbi:hypothetical protein ABT300_08925 [Streptomyces sp. NPDC001027]|uniref:hypothetical protein n=1 Tax=Streptomyces sp. NPDC001027 TaxID=3154771 RepID=UPI00332EC50D